MHPSIRSRTPFLLSFACAALVPLAIITAGCGGGEPPPPAAPSAPPEPSAAPSAEPSAAPEAPAPSAAPSASAAEAPPPPPAAGSTKVTIKNDPAFASCHQSYVAKGKDVSKDVAAMAKGCAKVTKMKLVGKTLKGKQADKDSPQTFPLKAKANHCYRAYAQAASGIKDLDLAIKDSTGAIAGEDSTDDPSPVVLEDGAVCFKENDAATVVVSVGMGSGEYAVQVWGN
ncbi:MAG: hypothetical protein ACREJ3_17655 [Polyangiaceae bacterium]